MKSRPIEDKKRYLIAFTIGTAIFILGFVITHSITYFEYQRVSNLQEPTSYEIFSDKLRYSFFGENPCSEDAFLQLSDDLSKQGQILGDVEAKLGKDNEDVLFRKKFFALLQVEHLEFVQELNKECNLEINTILFFYSNDENDIDKSEGLGNLLGVLYERNSDRIALYSIDLNLNSSIVQGLKEKYNVTETVIILNENERFYSIGNIDEIENQLI